MPTTTVNPPGWVPIRSLLSRHRPGIVAHLLALGPEDRYLRFGYRATDEQIQRYVERIDFDRDEVFGIFNRRLELLALAHLAHPAVAAAGDAEPVSEFGVSVLRKARRRGYGARLFEHAMLHARNRGVELLMIHALSENTAMLKIARNAGAKVLRQGSESDAWLRLPPDTIGSHLDEMFGRQAAEFDYRFKQQARNFKALLGTVPGVPDRPAGTVSDTERGPDGG